MTSRLNNMMKQAGITKHPHVHKPGHIQKSWRKSEAHMLAHRTYLEKRKKHQHHRPEVWWQDAKAQRYQKLHSTRSNGLFLITYFEIRIFHGVI